MKWIHVDERLPEVGEKCWYFFDVVGAHRGFYGGLYEDVKGINEELENLKQGISKLEHSIKVEKTEKEEKFLGI